jgi:hypothetical protein
MLRAMDADYWHACWSEEDRIDDKTVFIIKLD